MALGGPSASTPSSASPLPVPPPSAPPGAPEPTTAPGLDWTLVGLILFGTFLTSFDNNMVAVTYPTLTDSLRATVAAVAWVGLGFLLARTTLLAVFGRLVDVRGGRSIYRAGFWVYAVGGVMATLAPNLLVLVICRAFIAAGAAMVTAAGTAILLREVPRRRLAGAVGFVESTVSAALILGPTCSGLVIQAFGWRPVFLMDLPLALAGLAWAARRLPGGPEHGRGRGFDWLGAGTLTVGLGGILLGASLAPQYGWAAPPVLGLFAAGALGLATFVAVERGVDGPLLDLKLFANRVFGAATASKVFVYAASSAGLFLLPFYLERLLGFPPALVGLALIPQPVAMAAGALAAGYLGDRIGSRLVTPAALLLGAGGLAEFITVQPAAGYSALLVAMLVSQVGLGGFYSANDSAILKSAPPGKSGIASGVLAMMRTIGQMSGIALAAIAFPAARAAAARPAVVLATFHLVAAIAVGLCLIGTALSLLRVGVVGTPQASRGTGSSSAT